MNAYEVSLVQTQPIINCLYILVISILPILWFGDCRKTMSLLFKRIRRPDFHYLLHEQTEITNSFQILVIGTAVVAYFLHRRWRNYSLSLRCSVLAEEIRFTDNKETNDLKIKLLKSINNIIEKKANIRSYIHNEKLQKVNDDCLENTDTIEKAPMWIN